MTCPFCQATAVVGIEFEELYDGVIYWECRSCRVRWHRFSAGDDRRVALEAAYPALVFSEPKPVERNPARRPRLDSPAPIKPENQEPEPTRREFRFKAAEFERLNPRPGVQPPPEKLPESPGTASASSTEPAAGSAPNPDVFALLQLNRARSEPTEILPVISPWRKRQRRLWVYLLLLMAVDGPAAVIAFYIGHRDPFLFVPLVGAAAYFTGWLTWNTWFLRV